MDGNIEEIIKVGKNLHDKNLVSGKAGNISIRVHYDEGDVVAITPTLSSLGDLDPENIVLVNLDGNVINNGNPSSEIGFHLEIYKKREDVNAIVHTHSPYATGFAFSSKKIKRLEGFGQIKTPFIEEIEYEKPGSVELSKAISNNINQEDVLILKHHGILCVGENLKEAESLALFIEDTAKTQFVTHMLNLTENKD